MPKWAKSWKKNIEDEDEEVNKVGEEGSEKEIDIDDDGGRKENKTRKFYV